MQFKVRANLDIESAARLAETWAEAEVAGLAPVAIPPQLQYTRRIFVTYLDSELVILRDETGSPTLLTRSTPVVEPVVLAPDAASSPAPAAGDA